MKSKSYTDKFVDRHIGPDNATQEAMLNKIGVSSIEQLIEETVPASIKLKNELPLPDAISEYELLSELKNLANHNQLFRSYIGMGYHACITPPVLLRNILENPGWYTAYTPYQAEIAQGRLEALINYQTAICELTGMELANASLLDEATASAEAMQMLFALRKGAKKNASKFFVSENCHPQTIEVLKSRAVPVGIELVIGDETKVDFSDANLFGTSFFGILLQYPGSTGNALDYSKIIELAHQNQVLVACAADIMALTLLKPPGEMGADVVIGNTQRLGVPLGYGGPHAAYFATRSEFKRQIPGRVIGASKDRYGNIAYRMALQTREQHIRREKATSNICTSQVLLAVLAGMYVTYHGSKGLEDIARRIHCMTYSLEQALSELGYKQINNNYFDTLCVEVEHVDLIRHIAENTQINFRYIGENLVCISLDETVNLQDIENIVSIFARAANKTIVSSPTLEHEIAPDIKRQTTFLQQEVFNKYHSEHEMLRYLKRLENKDLSLTHSMISLGSCTMKLNATAEMIPITWPEFGNIHPFAPLNQAGGYQELFDVLNNWLCEITGFHDISFQPNSGAQGEYAGLMVIRSYHKSRGQEHRNVALIPASAHGTNPASAVMAGMKVVVVKCDENGNIDVADLKEKATEHKDRLSALLVTYPSTHGVFEESIIEICAIIHSNGGQVYMDGANMNAQVGITSPATIGADVCHLNLHKTFCIPHGGGGPGMGPIGVAEHLTPFLPGHPHLESQGSSNISAIAAAPWGSASILPISYAYIRMMGAKGLKKATEIAILNANYLLNQLKDHFPILYVGAKGRCAHEMIVDFRQFKTSAGIEVEDIAKRLMDYGFHAPTVSFPVAGTMMIEPTESESKEELDRFCEAMIQIREEIKEIENGIADKTNNVLKNAPHTSSLVTADEWTFPYNRAKAAFPLTYLQDNKFWPAVSRIDSAFGDRNLICTCTPIEAFAALQS